MTTTPANRQSMSAMDPHTVAEATGPGALQGQVWLTLQTRHAQRLVRGRPAAPDKPAIIGLFGFADRLRGIWLGARRDDPYADWWLLKIHAALAAAEQRIQAGQQFLAERLAASPALEVTVAASQKPYRTPLRFANPYAYRGAQWLGEYDNLACGVLSAVHVGLMDKTDAERMLGQCAGKLRALFCVPVGYRFLGVDRTTLAQGTAAAAQAQMVMGEVPEAVMTGEQQAPLSPRKPAFTRSFSGQPRPLPVANPQPEVPAAKVYDGGD